MHKVVVLALPGVVALELAIPFQVFATARAAGHRTERLTGDGRLYDVRIGAPQPTLAATASGGAAFSVAGLEPLAVLETAGTVIVPATESAAGPSPDVIAALRAAHARGARIASICTGASLLAAAGLLDGRRATTHWAHADELAARHPSVRVDPSVLFVDDGDVLTAAGVAAGLDLCLHLVRRDHGAAAAGYVARRIVMPPHREGGQAQYLPAAGGDPGGSALAPTLAWLRASLADDHQLADIARHAAMSTRTLVRRFRAECGTTPLQWLIRQRVDHARELLETTSLPVEEVARQAGFHTSASLRQHFARLLGTSPLRYRRTFQQVPA
ncbi:GlxA family transcriptional regulator [Jiangella alba]|uniref:Transcriptional regulator GlxA family, contains an amidase domain and an AraC-type DNA-binding HTH domain n=1 Tax=Jiangella alba TaxID=561176 RepID=A0A1H5PY33_9ACTN|nr:helix-turn-helix domain-containing protein [Jiangella alba]SEF17927.1 Transcriptional regulator GlxA family, contains an amidase domain and an AraC-type DNA-binding HTH domain [Jiangella alba]